MSEGTDKIRAWASSDREQAAAHTWFAAIHENNGKNTNAADELAKAAADNAEADGWEEVAQAADDQVDTGH